MADSSASGGAVTKQEGRVAPASIAEPSFSQFSGNEEDQPQMTNLSFLSALTNRGHRQN